MRIKVNKILTIEYIASELEVEYTTMWEEDSGTLHEFIELSVNRGESRISLDRKEAFHLFNVLKESFDFSTK